MKKQLEYFVQYDRADRVAIGVVLFDDDGKRVGTGLEEGSDEALTAAAKKAKRSTWCQETICAVHGLERAAEPVVEKATAADASADPAPVA